MVHQQASSFQILTSFGRTLVLVSYALMVNIYRPTLDLNKTMDIGVALITIVLSYSSVAIILAGLIFSAVGK
jgi:hypothetical protein